MDIEAEGGFIDDFDPEEQDRARRVTAEDIRKTEDDKKEALRRRAEAYRRLFASADKADFGLVMQDLRRFCRADSAVWADDPREHALLTGRNEVWWRINDHLSLSGDELYEKYNTRR